MLCEVNIRRLIHKLFKPVIECPAHSVLRPGHGSELRGYGHAIEVHAVDAKDRQRTLQAQAEQRIAADLPASRIRAVALSISVS